MTDKEAWVRFACAAMLAESRNKPAVELADAMLVLMKERDLDDEPEPLVLDEPVEITFSPEHVCGSPYEGALRIVGDVSTET